MNTTRPRRPLGFGVELFAIQIAVITVVIALFTWAAAAAQAANVRDEKAAQIRALAQSAASLPTVVAGLRSDDPAATIQPVMVALREASGVDYITVVDLDNRRVSHPDPSLMGLPPSTDHTDVRAGEEFVGTERGTVGLTFRVKLPIRAEDGAIVGTMSVGIAESRLTNDVVTLTWQLVAVAGAALVAGSLLSWVVTRAIRRRLYGVDPDELRTLLQTRDSMVDAVSDGFIAVDSAGRVALANSAAERLLQRTDLAGSRASEALPAPVAALLDGSASARAQIELDGQRVVVARSEARLRGHAVGTTLVLQNRTELERALDDLDAQTVRANTMRRETHEFENRMHVLAGLLGLGAVDEAARLRASFPASVRPGIRPELAGIEPPVLAALLDARITLAQRRGVRLEVTDDSAVTADCALGSEAITVVGNLLSNAVDAARSRVLVYLDGDAAGLTCRVEDDGPGVPPHRRATIFEEGVTTKSGIDAGTHGVGLHLVATLLAARGGTIDVDTAELGGAAFEAWLPASATAREARP